MIYYPWVTCCYCPEFRCGFFFSKLLQLDMIIIFYRQHLQNLVYLPFLFCIATFLSGFFLSLSIFFSVGKITQSFCYCENIFILLVFLRILYDTKMVCTLSTLKILFHCLWLLLLLGILLSVCHLFVVDLSFSPKLLKFMPTFIVKVFS